MRVGIARYPYFRQALKGGDYVLFDAIVSALSEEHTVDFINYRRPGERFVKFLPNKVAKVYVWLIDLLLPILFTRQLFGRMNGYDVVLADSAVLTRLPRGARRKMKLISLINIDYGAYLGAVGKYMPLRARTVMRWKSWLQDRGIASYRSVAVSSFVLETVAKRGLPVDRIVENQVQDLPPLVAEAKASGAIVYAGSGDYWGKGLDVLVELAATGLDVHTYGPAKLSRCISHGAVSRKALLQALPCYEVMVFPSRYESFGLVAIEAMAMGIPVVMRRTGVGVELAKVLPECIVPDVPSNDDWQSAVRTVAADRKRIVAAGKKFAEAYLDGARFALNWRTAVNDVSSAGRVTHGFHSGHATPVAQNRD